MHRIERPLLQYDIFDILLSMDGVPTNGLERIPQARVSGELRGSIQARAEQDYLNIRNLVHFDVLVTVLVGKIPTGNVLFLFPFQDIHL